MTDSIRNYHNLRREFIPTSDETDNKIFQDETNVPAILYTKDRQHKDVDLPTYLKDVRGFGVVGADITFDMSLEKMLPPKMRRILALGAVGLSGVEIEETLQLEEGVVGQQVESFFRIARTGRAGERKQSGLASALLAGGSPLAHHETTVRENIFADCSAEELRIINLRSQGWSYEVVAQMLGYTADSAQTRMSDIMDKLRVRREALLATLYTLTLRTYSIYGVTLDDIAPRKQVPGLEI